MVGAFIPGDVIAGGFGALVVAVIYLARTLARLGERVARIEGRLNGRDEV